MDKNNFLFGRTMYKTLNRMKTCIGNKFFGKFLITGLLCFGTAVFATGQSAESLSRSFWAHQNNRCSSGHVYVIELYESGRHTGTAYYCENERSEANNVMSLNGKKPNLRFRLSLIDNSGRGSSTGSGYNQPSPADIQAEQQRQAELEKQREQERLEQERKFKEGQQELIAGLKGMSQEVTKPLELMGDVQTSDNSLELMGMNQTSTTNDLKLMDINQTQTSVNGVLIDDTNGMPYVNYRPSGIILPEIKMSITENSIPFANIRQISKTNTIEYDHPYIELVAGTTKAIIPLLRVAGTLEAIVAVPTVNIWKENIKAWRDFQKYGKVTSTKEILYNAFWDDGKVPAEILGDLVSAGIMKKGTGYLIRNAEKYGIEPYRSYEIITKADETVNAIQTGLEEGKAWGAQIGNDIYNTTTK